MPSLASSLPDECQQKYGNANVWKACCAVFDYLNLAAVSSSTTIPGERSSLRGLPPPRSSTAQYFACTAGCPPNFERSTRFASLLERRRFRTRERSAVRSSFARVAQVGAEPPASLVADLMWSDPDDIETWSVSPRGAGWLFGSRVTNEVRPQLSSRLSRPELTLSSQFNQVNSLSLIARAHQLVQEGYKYMFAPENNLVTVWSAPNYCYRCGNVASVMEVREGGIVDKDSFKIFEAGAPLLSFLG